MSVSTSEPISATEPQNVDCVEKIPGERPGRANVWLLAGVLAVMSLLLLYHLGPTPSVSNREIRIFKVIQGMVKSGDYLVPRIDGKPHLTKPPLYYWLGSLFAKTGLVSSPVACRLPSVLGALLLLGTLYGLCRAMRLPHLALPAVMVLSCCHEFYTNAREANFDMLLGAGCLLAVTCFYQYLQSARFGWLLASGVATTLALLTKATPALVEIYVPVVVLLATRRELKTLRRPAVIGVCFIVPLALCIAWFVLLLKLAPQAREVFKSEGLLPFGVRSEHDTATHYAGPFFFCYKILKIAAPAVLLLPLLWRRLTLSRYYKLQAQALAWPLWSFLVIFLIFSIIPQKQEAYLLPILPYLALLIAEAAAQGLGNPDNDGLFKGVGYVGTALFAAAAVLGGFFYHTILQNTPVAIVAALAAFGLAALVFAQGRARRFGRLLAIGACGWWLVMACYLGDFKLLDNRFKTGEILKSPDYNRERWDELKKKYPPLAQIFNTSKRFTE